MKTPWMANPAELMRASAAWTKLMMDMALMGQNAAFVIARRNMMMMSGKMSAREAARMVLEKPAAFAEAAEKAAAAAFRGKDAVGVAAAALKPVARKAKANAKRL